MMESATEAMDGPAAPSRAWLAWAVLATLAMVAALLVPCAVHAAPAGYTFCSAQNTTCTVPSSGLVIFGCDVDTDPSCTTPAYIPPTSTSTLGGGSYPFGFTCAGATPGMYDPAFGKTKACWYLLDSGPASAPEPSGGNIDWSNAAHLMQALMVACCCFSWFLGYRAGDKT